MARIFITGSSDGLGSLAAQALVKNGHRVVLHARNAQRAKDAEAACPGAETVLIADLSSIEETKQLAEQVNKLGEFDCVVHNAGLYRGQWDTSVDGIPKLVAVNTYAPYILTCLINRPKRLVYVSSGLHHGGNPSLKDLSWKSRGERSWSDSQAYADSKLHNILLANAISRKWPKVVSSSLDPGWVPTKMGGSSAPGDFGTAVRTYVMLAEGKTDETGKYWYSEKERSPKKEAGDTKIQDQYMKLCSDATGVSFPE